MHEAGVISHSARFRRRRWRQRHSSATGWIGIAVGLLAVAIPLLAYRFFSHPIVPHRLFAG